MMDITPQDFLWIAPLVAWELAWKGMAMWKAARKNERGWFVTLLLLNTAGLLPIAYLWSRQKTSK